jgi:hypothetical protein
MGSFFIPDRDEIGTELRSFLGESASATLRHDPAASSRAGKRLTRLAG